MKQTRSALLKWLARSLVKVIPMGEAAADFATDVLPVLSSDVFDWWRGSSTAEERRKDLETLAQADPAEAKAEAEAAVAEVLAETQETASPERVERVQKYLEQVPDAIRRSMRRPTDSSGRTVPPHLAPRTAAELGALLPQRPPTFHIGDRPIPGVDVELIAPLGTGGFGEVWRARKTHLGQDVALKFCLDPTASLSLRNETSLLRRLMSGDATHPGIVRLLATYNDCTVLEYEFVEGGDLAGLIREWHADGKRPTPKQTLDAIRQIAEIVAFAHALQPPLVHRDLKPANILVQRKADGALRCRLTDFGIGGIAVAKQVEATQRGQTQSASTALHGSYSFLYASPQQMRAERPDPTDDVYSLGVIFWQLANGDMADGAPGGTAWTSELETEGYPRSAIAMMASCFDRRLERRPQTAAAFVEALKEPTPPALKSAVVESNKPTERQKPQPQPQPPAEIDRVRSDLRAALASAPFDAARVRAIADRLQTLVPNDPDARQAHAAIAQRSHQRSQRPPAAAGSNKTLWIIGIVVAGLLLSSCVVVSIIAFVVDAQPAANNTSNASPAVRTLGAGDTFVQNVNTPNGVGTVVQNSGEHYLLHPNGSRIHVAFNQFSGQWEDVK